MKDEKKENREWDDREYPIRVYTKVELALLYNPSQSMMVAINTLSRWIRMNSLLTKELHAIGYNKFRHSFTPREVELIFKYMGEPGM